MKGAARHWLAGVACVALIAVGVVRWRAAALSAGRLPVVVGDVGGSVAGPPDSTLASAEEVIVSNDPFRLSNKPPTTRFAPGSQSAGGAIGATAPLVRPNLVLKAIVGGPPWQAIVDGLPGAAPGTLLASGAVFDKRTVRAVTRDSVIIQGPDTSWVLSFRKLAR